MLYQPWSGKRPEICEDVWCAANERYWYQVLDSGNFPRYWWEAHSNKDYKVWVNGPKYEDWSVFFYCNQCHGKMDTISRLLRELREVGIRD